MTNEEFKHLMTDYVSGKLNTEQEEQCEAFVLSHPEVLPEVESLKTAWLKLDTISIPEPSPNMDATFYAFLKEQEQVAVPKESFFQQLRTYFSPNSQGFMAKQLAFGAVLLIGGLFLGSKFSSDATDSPTLSEERTSNETEQVRSDLVLALIEQPSATKRLQGVNEASKLDNATSIIIQALFKTLNNDPNTNVRLATIESLMKYVEKPEVRAGLVKSINHQSSPLVQIALADLMVALQEKTSIQSMEELLQEPNMDTTVKEKLRSSIQEIS